MVKSGRRVKSNLLREKGGGTRLNSEAPGGGRRVKTELNRGREASR